MLGAVKGQVHLVLGMLGAGMWQVHLVHGLSGAGTGQVHLRQESGNWLDIN